MRITSKGQVTIPQEIRERLGLLPHSEVEFDVVGESVRMRRARKPTKLTRGDMIVAHSRGSASKRFRSTDELMKLLRADD